MSGGKFSGRIRFMIDEIIPMEKVLADGRAFLDECEWELEIEDSMITIPKGTDLQVQTRAYILANAPDIFLGDHYEAVLLLGSEEWSPIYGYLKMYYDLQGNFISEDRFPAQANRK